MDNEATYKLFLDDSGTKEYAKDWAYSKSGGKTLYFVFGGLLVRSNDVPSIEDSLNQLKTNTFGSPNVEIKANWLRRGEEKAKRYLNKYGLSERELSGFTDSVYELINECDCKLLACVVNKREVQQKYPNPHYPPAIAYECILQRAQQEMNERTGRANVTIDDMDGATPSGNQYLYLLKRQHNLLKNYGSRLIDGMAFDRINKINFRDSQKEELLQLSDLVAYSVYRQFVDYGPEWEQSVGELPTYEYLNRIARKFRQSSNGRIQGYGIVKFPVEKKILWQVR